MTCACINANCGYNKGGVICTKEVVMLNHMGACEEAWDRNMQMKRLKTRDEVEKERKPAP